MDECNVYEKAKAKRKKMRKEKSPSDAAKGRAGGSLPTYCSSMTYLSAGFLHVQSAVSTALGSLALGGNASCPSGGLTIDVTYEQAPLGLYQRSFGSLTMRLFAAVYLTMSLSTLLAASAGRERETDKKQPNTKTKTKTNMKPNRNKNAYASFLIYALLDLRLSIRGTCVYVYI